MPGLVPDIHVFLGTAAKTWMAGTSIAKTRFALLPGHDARWGTSGVMAAEKLVLQRQRHLKWRALDRLELALMIICGALCFGFSLSVTADIVTRVIGSPWLWLQEVTSTLFIYAIFIGTAVATRRNDHLYLTAISVIEGSKEGLRP